MKISTNSWHYRMVERYNTAPDNLCPYMRKLIFTLVQNAIKLIFTLVQNAILLVMISSLGVMGIAIALAPILFVIQLHVVEFLPLANENFEGFFSTMVLTGFGMYLVGVITFIYQRSVKVIVEMWQNRNETRQEAMKAEPTIVSSWLKDIKNKTCTSIEFVDNAK